MKKHIILTTFLLYSIAAQAQRPLLRFDYKTWKTKTAAKANVNLSDDTKGLLITNRTAAETTAEPTWYSVFSTGGTPDSDEFNTETLNKYLYNQNTFDVLQSLSMQTLGNGTYVNAEFGSFLFGPVRLGIGGAFKTSGDTTKDDAIKSSIQKVISSGGSVNFNFSLPLYFVRSKNDQLHFGVWGETLWGINPNIDDSTGATSFASSNINFSNQTGLMIHFDVGSNDQTARLYFDIPIHYSWGNTQTEELGLPDFSLVKLRAGISIKDLFIMYISGPLYSTSSKVQSTPFSFSMQVSPSQISKLLSE